MLAGFIGLFSLYVASKPKDTDHPYGHGKAEFISSATEGTLIVAAGIFILYQTVENIITNTPIEKINEGLWLIVSTAVINYVVGIICIKKGKQNRSLALQTSGKHLLIDTYSTLIILAALIAIIFTKWYWIDKAVALIMGIIIVFNGYKIIRQSFAGIMDEADMNLLKHLIKMLNDERRENWIDVHNLRIIKYGSVLHIDCHLTVPWYLNVKEAHTETSTLASKIMHEFGGAIEMFVHTDACTPPYSCKICIKHDCLVRQHSLETKLEWTLKNILTDRKHYIGELPEAYEGS